MAKNILKTLHTMLVVLFAALAVTQLTACSDDDELSKIPKTKTYVGTLTTSIPGVEDFAPSVANNKVTVNYDDKLTTAKVEIGGFEVVIPQMGGRTVKFENLVIENLPVDVCCEETATITKSDFTCQSGSYNIEGNIVGEVSNGVLKLILNYKPAKQMPVEIRSEFEGK